jgi:hypothetical protein
MRSIHGQYPVHLHESRDIKQSVRQVPLDYKQPNGTLGAIALLKIPSALNTSDAAYRGPVLFNPGKQTRSFSSFVHSGDA